MLFREIVYDDYLLSVSEWWWSWADSQAKEKLLRSKRFIQVPTPVSSKNILWFKIAFSVKKHS